MARPKLGVFPFVMKHNKCNISFITREYMLYLQQEEKSI